MGLEAAFFIFYKKGFFGLKIVLLQPEIIRDEQNKII